LQKIVYDDLDDADKGFIVTKTGIDYQQMMENGIVIGVFKDNQLIGKAAATAQNPNFQSLVDFDDCLYPYNLCIVFQSVATHPDHRKNGIMSALVKARENYALQNGFKIALTEVAARNDKSKSVLSKNGFEGVSRAVDPNDGTELVHMAKRLTNG
jgi:GNAT superfamily N-acetyltransferase